ncbi:MAG TPA: 4-hydroxy-tetrahydrodipicolinate reductase [Nitriliruptorales bacterium]|nr:4-hydroxy-tetrahydrodipicolinate reductase [Nitriliruptorales bacterium]
MTRVGVVGAAGRMGQAVCQAVSRAADLELVARVGSGDALDVLRAAGAQVAVDFTAPEAVADHVAWMLEEGVHAVVGTTGWTDTDVERWRRLSASGDANAVVAPNFALGAVLMMRFAAMAARHLQHVEVIELHHDRKRDAPSGTALRTAEMIAAARGEVPTTLLEDGARPGSRGVDVHGIRVHAVRLPGLVANQAVIFGGDGQTLTIRHDTVDRTAFVPGVLLAIREVASRRGVTVGLEHLLSLETEGSP